MRLSSAARQRAIVNGALREPGEITASRTPERMSWSTITSPKTGDGVNDINAHLPWVALMTFDRSEAHFRFDYATN